MKRATAVTIVHQHARRCRGPHVATVATVVAALAAAVTRDRARFAAAVTAGAEGPDPAVLRDPALDDYPSAWCTPEYRARLLALATTRAVVTQLLADLHPRAASFADHAARHTGCGHDFNLEIVARPFDGARYALDPETGEDTRVACPTCKQKIAYTAPVFAIDADDPERLAGDPLPPVPPDPDASDVVRSPTAATTLTEG